MEKIRSETFEPLEICTQEVLLKSCGVRVKASQLRSEKEKFDPRFGRQLCRLSRTIELQSRELLAWAGIKHSN